jgi:CheY-like chemotaxis protein
VSAKPNREKPQDDDLAARELLAAYWAPEGCSVVRVSSGTAVMEVALRLLPDLIVTDVLMPGSGGLQTLFVLKNTRETSGIPAIVVSAISLRILGHMPAAPDLSLIPLKARSLSSGAPMHKCAWLRSRRDSHRIPKSSPYRGMSKLSGFKAT